MPFAVQRQKPGTNGLMARQLPVKANSKSLWLLLQVLLLITPATTALAALPAAAQTLQPQRRTEAVHADDASTAHAASPQDLSVPSADAALAADLGPLSRVPASTHSQYARRRLQQEEAVQLFPAQAALPLDPQQASEQAAGHTAPQPLASGAQASGAAAEQATTQAGAQASAGVLASTVAGGDSVATEPQLTFSAQQQKAAQAELIHASQVDAAQQPQHAVSSSGSAVLPGHEAWTQPGEQFELPVLISAQQAEAQEQRDSQVTGMFTSTLFGSAPGTKAEEDSDTEADTAGALDADASAGASATQSLPQTVLAAPSFASSGRGWNWRDWTTSWDWRAIAQRREKGASKKGSSKYAPTVRLKGASHAVNHSDFAPYRYGKFPDPIGGEFPHVNPPFVESTHRCLGSRYTDRVCHYHNLYLWNDTIYYATTDPGVLANGVPAVAMSWVVQPQSFADLQFGGDEGLWLLVVHPDDLPFDWQEQRKLLAEEVLAWKLTFQDNYGHLLGEHGPTMHAVLCAYMGRCQYSAADRESLHILLVHEDDGEMDILPPAGFETMHCFSKHPMRLTNDPTFDEKVVVLQHLVAGIGPVCRGFPWCRPSYGRNPLPAHLVASWKEYISHCIGLPSTLVAPVSHPNIVFVNRPYHVGRGFLNIKEAVEVLKSRITPQASITVHELDETSLREQAKIYQNASVLVQMHGAALGNMIFLPRGACIIDIVPQNNGDKHPWVFFMARDLQPLQYNPIAVPPQKTVLMLHKIKHTLAWRLLPAHWRERILEEGVCPDTNQDVSHQFDAYAACNFQWFLKNGNVILDMDQLAGAVEHAFRHLQMHEERMKDLGWVYRSTRFKLPS